MTKRQLIDRIAKETGITKKDTAIVCDALFDVLTDAIANDESVQISGFGIFSSKNRPVRMAKNPQNGESIQLSASKTAVFTASRTLKEKLNET